MTVSIRSYLAAGVATAAVGALAIAPIEQTAAQTMGARLYQLSSAVQPLIQPANAAAAVLGAIGDPTPATPNTAAASTAFTQVPASAAAVTSSAGIPTPPEWIWPSDSLAQSAGDLIINVYNALEPWFQWGWSVVAWGAGWVPIVGFFAQQINIAYATIEPLVAAVVYSFAYLIDGQAALIPQTLTNGVSAAWNNFIQGEVAWFESFLPPLPPIGSIFGAAATAAPTALAAATDVETTGVETTGVQTATETLSGLAGFKDAHEVATADSASVDTSVDAESSGEPSEVSPIVTSTTSTSEQAPASATAADGDATVSEADTAKPVTDPTAAAPANTAKPSNSSSSAVPDKAGADKAGADKGGADKAGEAKNSGPKAKGHSPKARSAKAAQQ